VKVRLEERAREEDAALRAGTPSRELKRLDEELAAVRRMNLRPSALAASLAEIEGERQEILSRATRGRTGAENRARQLLSRLPEIVAAYRHQVENAVKVLARVEVVEDAREATRRLLVDGRIVLAPHADRTAVARPVHFTPLG